MAYNQGGYQPPYGAPPPGRTLCSRGIRAHELTILQIPRSQATANTLPLSKATLLNSLTVPLLQANILHSKAIRHKDSNHTVHHHQVNIHHSKAAISSLTALLLNNHTVLLHNSHTVLPLLNLDMAHRLQDNMELLRQANTVHHPRNLAMVLLPLNSLTATTVSLRSSLLLPRQAWAMAPHNTSLGTELQMQRHVARP